MCLNSAKSSSSSAQTTEDNRVGVEAGEFGVAAGRGATVSITNTDAQGVIKEVLDLVRDVGGGLKDITESTVEQVTQAYQPPQNVGADEKIKSVAMVAWPAAVVIGGIYLLRKAGK